MYKRKLLEIGIPADINGFEYLNYAIQAYTPMQHMTDLYKEVAERLGTTPSRVERNIRHAISKTGQADTVGQFIAKYKILWEDA